MAVGVALLAAVLTLSTAQGATATASYSLGTYTVRSADRAECPSGFTCSGFRISCPGVKESRSGYLARRSPSGTSRGLVMFFSGKGGVTWETKRNPEAGSFMTKDLTSLGYQVVQVRWDAPWLAAADGDEAGPARLGCRPATVIKWTHDHIYKPRSHSVGRCGFCVVGVSAGASQISYALAFYGLDKYVDAAVPVSGPPHAALAKGCSADDRGYTWPSHTAQTMDDSYGYLEGGGPCEKHDLSWADRWEADGVDTGGDDYLYPETRITFLLGTKDGTRAPRHGEDYADRLRSAGSPSVSVNWVDGMHHEPWETAGGIAAVKAAILDNPIPGTVEGPSDAPIGEPSPAATRPSRRSPRPSPDAGETRSAREPSALAGRKGAGSGSWALVGLGTVAFASLAYAFQTRRRYRSRTEPPETSSPD